MSNRRQRRARADAETANARQRQARAEAVSDMEIGSVLEALPGDHDSRAGNLALGASGVALLSAAAAARGLLLLAVLRLDYVVDAHDLDDVPLHHECDTCRRKRAVFREVVEAAPPPAGAIVGQFLVTPLKTLRASLEPPAPAPGTGGYL